MIIGVGALVSIQASLWLAKRREVAEEILWKAAFGGLWPGGLIGARVYHVLDLWNEVYSLNPISTIYIWNGGLGIIGGLIGGFIGLLLYKRIANCARPPGLRPCEVGQELRIANLLNLAFFGLPLGQAIGRIGNLSIRKFTDYQQICRGEFLLTINRAVSIPYSHMNLFGCCWDSGLCF